MGILTFQAKPTGLAETLGQTSREHHMTETFSSHYLEKVAQTIDDACTACYAFESDAEGKGQRNLIDTMLTTLGKQWDTQGAEGSKFTNALKSNCVMCLAHHRETARLTNQFTCGIRQRIPENISRSRPNPTSR